MLPKSHRLTAKEVREVLKNGRSARAGGVSARYTKATQPKAAIVVSTKVAKSATERNKLRRKGYAALPQLSRGIHVVIFIQNKNFDPADIAAVCSHLS